MLMLHAAMLVQVAVLGVDNVDLDTARNRGILVTNTPGVLTEDTADMTMALILAVPRRMVEGAEYDAPGEDVTDILSGMGIPLSLDPEKAKALVKASGYDGTELQPAINEDKAALAKLEAIFLYALDREYPDLSLIHI